MGEGRDKEYYYVKVLSACLVYLSDKSGMKVKKLKLCIVWKNNFKAMGLILMKLNQGVRT
jgi:hypothetical protein